MKSRHFIGFLLFLSVLAACLGVVSCGTGRRIPYRADTALADSLWTFSQSHPDGFTLQLISWDEPREGIAVSYAATQDRHDRASLDFVIGHALSHNGYVGGWLNTEDSLFYFDSVRLFREDSLAAAIDFGRANHQMALYILSSGEEIRLE